MQLVLMQGAHPDTTMIRRGWGWLLLASLTVSTVGDEISLIALIFRTADDDAPFAVPMLLVAQLLPGLLAAPFIGRLIDARDAAKLLLLASIAEALVLVWIAHYPDLVSTLLGAGALSILFAISGAATFALIPVIAAGLGMALSRANSILELVRGAGMLIGPVAGGVLVAWVGTRNALLIDAASFLLLTIVLLGSRLRRPAIAAEGAGTATLLADYLPILRNRRIGVMTGSLGLEVFASAIADVAFVFLVTVTLGQGPLAFGLVTACWALGMIAGAIGAGVRPMTRPGPIAFAAATAIGATMLAIGVAGWADVAGIVLIGAIFIIGGLANSVHNVAVRTMLQKEAPLEQHGKVAALYGAITSTAVILGYVAGGLFTPNDAVDAYLLGGTLGITAGAVGWRLYRNLAR